MTQADASYRRILTKLASCELLILDDWGLESLNAQQWYEMVD